MRPPSLSNSCIKGGIGWAANESPFPAIEIFPEATSISMVSPSSTASTTSGHSKIRSPILNAFRKKMRAKLLATTQLRPQPLRAMGACSREDPQPKFLPATIISPGFTFCANDGSLSSIQCLANSLESNVVRCLAGIITSVSILSPNFQTLPVSLISPPDPHLLPLSTRSLYSW